MLLRFSIIRMSDACHVTATVSSRSWEVWRSDWGNVETRNFQESALEGAPVSFGVGSGDGSVDTTTVVRMRKVMQ